MLVVVEVVDMHLLIMVKVVDMLHHQVTVDIQEVVVIVILLLAVLLSMIVKAIMIILQTVVVVDMEVEVQVINRIKISICYYCCIFIVILN